MVRRAPGKNGQQENKKRWNGNSEPGGTSGGTGTSERRLVFRFKPKTQRADSFHQKGQAREQQKGSHKDPKKKKNVLKEKERSHTESGFVIGALLPEQTQEGDGASTTP